MGGDSCCIGREFKSHHRIIDGHFLTRIWCKIYNVLLKKTEKDAGDGPFYKNKNKTILAIATNKGKKINNACPTYLGL